MPALVLLKQLAIHTKDAYQIAIFICAQHRICLPSWPNCISCIQLCWGQIGGEGSDLGKEEEKDKGEGRREEGEERRDIKTGSKDGLACTTSHG